MTRAISTENTAMQYLLGRLAEGKQEEVEESFFADAAVFDDLLVAENELIDAYAAGQLKHDDRVRFEGRLLLTRRQLERSKFAGALIAYARTYGRIERVSKPGQGRLTGYFRILSPRSMALGLSAAALLMMAAAGLWFLPAPRPHDEAAASTDSRADPQIAATPFILPDAPSTNDTAEAPPAAVDPVKTNKPVDARLKGAGPGERSNRSILATIVLPLGSTRDMTTSSSFTVPRAATRVNLKAAVESPDSERSYFAVLETVDGQQVWRGRASAGKPGSVNAAVPSRRLTAGDYIFTLKQRTSRGTYETVGEYSFKISGPR